MNKPVICAQAVEMIPDGAPLMVGGFMGVGSPYRLIEELVRQNIRENAVLESVGAA